MASRASAAADLTVISKPDADHFDYNCLCIIPSERERDSSGSHAISSSDTQFGAGSQALGSAARPRPGAAWGAQAGHHGFERSLHTAANGALAAEERERALRHRLSPGSSDAGERPLGDRGRGS